MCNSDFQNTGQQWLHLFAKNHEVCTQDHNLLARPLAGSEGRITNSFVPETRPDGM